MKDSFEYTPDEQQKKQLIYLRNLVKLAKERFIEFTIYGGYGLDGLYGNLTRDHHDLDLLVKLGDREKLKKLLLSLDYYFERENASKEVFKHRDLGEDFQIEINKQSRLKEFLQVGEDNIFPKEDNAGLDDFNFKSPTLKGHDHIYKMQGKRAREKGWRYKYRYGGHTKRLKELIERN